MHRPKYRKDITALRVIAVLLILVFHLDASQMPGGFVGVDIFFMISGYLITLTSLAYAEYLKNMNRYPFRP